MSHSQLLLPKRVACGISGGGRTLANLLEQEKSKAYKIAAVISSTANCPGLELARQQGLPTFIGRFQTENPPELVNELSSWLKAHAIDWIALAGFLKPFPVVHGYENRIINIHPALLPKYGGKGMYGIRVHEAVLANQEAFSGATIHSVNEHYDEGAIIAQIRVSIAGCHDPKTIAAQVFAAECKLYPMVLDLLCKNQLPLPQPQIFSIEA